MAKDAVGEIMITQEQIDERARELGAQITRDYAGEELVMVCILKGAVLWMGDIMKHVKLDTIIDFMTASSYGASRESSGVVTIKKDLDSDIKGKPVLLVEDIVDSGITLNYLKHNLQERGAKSVRICTLLDKPAGRKTDIRADYVGFEVEDKFIVGYGLDFNQKYRNLPYISFLKD